MRRLALGCVLLTSCMAALAAGEVRHVRDIVYATADGKPIALDLHLPDTGQPPLVIYLHGGAWMAGDKSGYPTFLTDHGFAVASLDFRSTNDAPFPANVHDIKAGVRFLRAKAGEYGYRADRIALAGVSSGGHLAVLAGVTGGDARFEGAQGDHRDQSSDVQAIVSWFGAGNLTTILAQSTPFGLSVREPALRKLLGGTPREKPDLARLASPVYHVDRDDPPLMLLHGDQDPQMPINQLHELQGAYESAGARVETMVLHGVAHDAAPFFTGTPARRVAEFLSRMLVPGT